MRRIPSVTADIILGRMRTIDNAVVNKDQVESLPTDYYRVEMDQMLDALKKTEISLSDALERSQVTSIQYHLEQLDEQWISLQNLVAKQTEFRSVSLLPALSGICKQWRHHHINARLGKYLI